MFAKKITLALLSFGVFYTAVACGKTYQCRNSSGQLMISDASCPVGSKTEKVRIFNPQSLITPQTKVGSTSNTSRAYQSNLQYLNMKIDEAINARDFRLARQLALTPEHWKKIDDAEKNNESQVMKSGVELKLPPQMSAGQVPQQAAQQQVISPQGTQQHQLQQLQQQEVQRQQQKQQELQQLQQQEVQHQQQRQQELQQIQQQVTQQQVTTEQGTQQQQLQQLQQLQQQEVRRQQQKQQELQQLQQQEVQRQQQRQQELQQIQQQQQLQLQQQEVQHQQQKQQELQQIQQQVLQQQQQKQQQVQQQRQACLSQLQNRPQNQPAAIAHAIHGAGGSAASMQALLAQNYAREAALCNSIQ